MPSHRATRSETGAVENPDRVENVRFQRVRVRNTLGGAKRQPLEKLGVTVLHQVSTDTKVQGLCASTFYLTSSTR